MYIISMNKEQEFMAEAIREAEKGMNNNDGGPFGAVIVKEGKIIGRGHNCVTSTNDPTAHAEVNAIRDASKYLNTYDLSGCEIYTSCEPCPMCLSAIYWARLDRIYYGNTREDAAMIGFSDNMIYEEIKLSPEKRVIPMQQRLHVEAAETFKRWMDKTDKRMY